MITAFTGLPGSGKTITMTLQAYEYWKLTNVPVFANYNVRFPINTPKKILKIDWRHGKYWYEWSEKQRWFYPAFIHSKDMLEAIKQVDKALFLIDEAGTVFDNRSWRTFEKWAMARFRESRHAKLEIMYTAQSIGDVDLKLRQLTNFMVKCQFIQFLYQFDIGLKNEKYHNEVIKSDTPANRNEYKAGYQFYFPFQFKKAYHYYNTMERMIYDAPIGKKIEDLIQPNTWEVMEKNQNV
jgi:hypothetical protein